MRPSNNVWNRDAFHMPHGNGTIWIAFLITPEHLPMSIRTNYETWLIVEFAGHIFNLLCAALSILFIWKVRAYHINLAVLTTYAIAILCTVNTVTRFPLMLIEAKFLHDYDIDSFLIPLMLVKLCAWIGIYHYVHLIMIERCMAFYFSSDYETSQRLWLSWLIILVNTLLSIGAAYLILFCVIDGVIYVAGNFLLSNLSCLIFSRITSLNRREQTRLVTFSSTVRYSVSKRWQIHDNLRLAKDIRILLFGVAAQIAFYLAVFFVPPFILGEDPQWLTVLEASKAVFQLICSYGFGIAFVFMTLCFQRHRLYARTIVGCAEERLQTPVMILPGSQLQNAEEYFRDLRATWR